MTDPVDPSTPEREARGNATNAVIAWCFDRMTAEQRDAMLDTYAAAVYARALADVAGWVEGMRWSAVALPFMTEAECRDGYARLIRKSDILAKLREAKP